MFAEFRETDADGDSVNILINLHKVDRITQQGTYLTFHIGDKTWSHEFPSEQACQERYNRLRDNLTK